MAIAMFDVLRKYGVEDRVSVVRTKEVVKCGSLCMSRLAS